VGRDIPINGNELLQAFYKLRKSLGPAMTDVLLEGLRMYSINLESNKAYTLNELRKALNSVCGRDAASLIVERIEKRLHEKHKRRSD
jgi:hypothetical protein